MPPAVVVAAPIAARFPRCRWTPAATTPALVATVVAALALALAGCTGRIGNPGGGGSTTMPPGLAGPINPGRVVAHRLNNVEYDNTVRDLVGVDSRPSTAFGFPDDAYIEGFDNNADALTAPPLLLEKLQTATEAIVAGALDPAAAGGAARARIMTCDPAKAGEAACATQILTGFASRAFRRPVAANEVAGYAGLVGVAKGAGDGFEQGIAAGLQAILLSPRFLFRVEVNPGMGRIAALDDYEVASRLSYFLWSSMPDDALLARAAAGALHDGAAVVAEVQRMLADPKSSALVSSLAGEWLGSRELAVKEVTLTDVTFDAGLRTAMATEASMFLGEMLTGGHAVKELLGADFVFANDRLAAHYGFPGAAALGGAFAKRPLPDDKRSAGILSQANTLTVTSMRDRTSPTRRGKWVSENLLCVVIPPPPPMIPQLDPPSTTAPTSVRERLAAHRAKGSSCNGCHQYIDPLGFGLEHYDAVGRWRDTDNGVAIDATGNVPVTNVAFDGAISLAQAIKDDPRFLDCMIQKLMTYALGRSLAVTPPAGSAMDDTTGLADIRMQLGSSEGALGRLVELVATSPAMTMRIGEEAP
jgi:hypothetical protein